MNLKNTKLKCLIIVPFDPPGERIRETISRAMKELGIQVLRIGLHADLLTNAITEAIDSSDFIVVDVSRNNPNVMYELGYAHGTKKQTLIIRSEKSLALPSDLMGYMYIVYDETNLRSLQQQITTAAKRIIAQMEGS